MRCACEVPVPPATQPTVVVKHEAPSKPTAPVARRAAPPAKPPLHQLAQLEALAFAESTPDKSDQLFPPGDVLNDLFADVTSGLDETNDLESDNGDEAIQQDEFAGLLEPGVECVTGEDEDEDDTAQDEGIDDEDEHESDADINDATEEKDEEGDDEECEEEERVDDNNEDLDGEPADDAMDPSTCETQPAGIIGAGQLLQAARTVEEQALALVGTANNEGAVDDRNSSNMRKDYMIFLRETENRKKMPVSLAGRLATDKTDLFRLWLDNGRSLKTVEVAITRKQVKENESESQWKALKRVDMLKTWTEDKVNAMCKARILSGLFVRDPEFPNDESEFYFWCRPVAGVFSTRSKMSEELAATSKEERCRHQMQWGLLEKEACSRRKSNLNF